MLFKLPVAVHTILTITGYIMSFMWKMYQTAVSRLKTTPD
jgi:hypothetical protein